MYTLFVILHILSAGVFIGLGVVMVLSNRARVQSKGTAAELYYTRSMLRLLLAMGNIAGLGIFITSIVITSMSYAWFPFTTLPWLAIKQVNFLIMMALAGAIMVPTAKKAIVLMVQELTMPSYTSGASETLRAMVRKAFAIAMINQILILANVTLGEWKPMLWANG